MTGIDVSSGLERRRMREALEKAHAALEAAVTQDNPEQTEHVLALEDEAYAAVCAALGKTRLEAGPTS